MLLSPPEPPFVMGWPVMGPKKGGVTNFPYTPAWDPAKEEQKIHPEKGRMVTKIQSKHVAIFAQTAWDKDHYPVVTDDNMVFWLDRKLWEFLSGHIAKVLEIVPVPCLREWTPPTGNDWREGTIRWKELTDPLEPYRSAAWWQLLIDVSPRPDRTKKAETVTVGCNEQLSLV
jgi:hypothetical protein